MGRDRLPGPTEDELAGAMSRLAGMLLDERDLQQTLHEVAELSTRVVDGARHASVALMDGGTAVATAHTDPRTREVDHAQYATGHGPCLEAYETGRLQRTGLAEARRRWPAVTALAAQRGFAGFLAVPLTVRERAIGTVNLYAERPEAFDPQDESVAVVFAGQASVAVANARAHHNTLALVHQLEQALVSRAVIDQAKGVLMVACGIDADAAFAVLREQSQRQNRKVRDVARDLLDAQRRPVTPPGGAAR